MSNKNNNVKPRYIIGAVTDKLRLKFISAIKNLDFYDTMITN